MQNKYIVRHCVEDRIMAKDAKIQCTTKICKVINCMYQNIKTCIRKGNAYSEFFNCEIGVKQGELTLP
jgi:hypothetical protein